MSSRAFNFLNRIKNKSIDRIMTNTHVSTSYQYIQNFDTASEEDCIKLDTINREIYRKNMELYELISKKIETNNAMFKIDSPPQSPSEPNNHEKYISYKMRNIHNNVKYQSFAICYLLTKGYKLSFDKIDNKTEHDFEAYEAIDIFQKLENMSIDNVFKDKNYEFYTMKPMMSNLNMQIHSKYPYQQQQNLYPQKNHYMYNENNMEQSYTESKNIIKYVNMYPNIYPSVPSAPSAPSAHNNIDNIDNIDSTNNINNTYNTNNTNDMNNINNTDLLPPKYDKDKHNK